MIMNLKPADLLSPKGRINRLTFFVYNLGMTLIFIVLLIAITLIIKEPLNSQGEPTTQLGLVVVNLFYLLTAYFYFCIVAKRLHDIGHATYWAAIFQFNFIFSTTTSLMSAFVTLPISLISFSNGFDTIWRLLGGLAGIYILFIHGQKKANKYGPDPFNREDSKVGVF